MDQLTSDFYLYDETQSKHSYIQFVEGTSILRVLHYEAVMEEIKSNFDDKIYFLWQTLHKGRSFFYPDSFFNPIEDDVLSIAWWNAEEQNHVQHALEQHRDQQFL